MELIKKNIRSSWMIRIGRVQICWLRKFYKAGNKVSKSGPKPSWGYKYNKDYGVFEICLYRLEFAISLNNKNQF